MISMIKQRSGPKNCVEKSALAVVALVLFFLFAQTASAQVVINEIQISPIGERFIELYNSSSSDVDLTGWYLQRKTATGSSFGSLVTSTFLKDKIIKANGYFLISRQRDGSDVVVDSLTLTESNTIRMRDSKGEDIDQVELGVVPDGKSYQKISTNEWVSAVPTPGVVNSGVAELSGNETASISSPTTANATGSAVGVSTFPTEPQIFADAGVSARTISAGATVPFTGRAFGLKKEPIENARMIWSFGDGGIAEGTSVAHTYHYPGDYIAVLDIASGYYSASDRVAVHVVVPLLILRSGGDTTRSFISIENRGSDEVDLSLWQIESAGIFFIIPKNTILGARKTLTFASEITGLSSSQGSVVALRFPNSSIVNTQVDSATQVPVVLVQAQVKTERPIAIKTQPIVKDSSESKQYESAQEASVSNAFSDSLPIDKNDNKMWMWYTAVTFIAVFALLGLRSVRRRSPEIQDGLQADDFEIVEDDNFNKKGNLF